MHFPQAMLCVQYLWEDISTDGITDQLQGTGPRVIVKINMLIMQMQIGRFINRSIATKRPLNIRIGMRYQDRSLCISAAESSTDVHVRLTCRFPRGKLNDGVDSLCRHFQISSHQNISAADIYGCHVHGTSDTLIRVINSLIRPKGKGRQDSCA